MDAAYSPARQGLQYVCPSVVATVPGAQTEQTVAPVAELYVPCGHASQRVFVTANQPIGHLTHDSEPSFVETEPNGHGVQILSPEFENAPAGQG